MKNHFSVMVFSNMSSDDIGWIHVIDGTLNSTKYIDTSLGPIFISSIRDLFPNNVLFIFQQDSDPCHTEIILKMYFDIKSVKICHSRKQSSHKSY